MKHTKESIATIRGKADLALQNLPLSDPDTSKWESPIPFKHYDTPRFPSHLFCKPITDFIETLAEETQTPVDLAGTSVIAVLSASTQGKFEIQVNHNWKLTLSTYTVTVLESGSGKTSVHDRAAAPLVQYEQQIREEKAEDVAKAQAERRLIEKKRDHAERMAATADTTIKSAKWRDDVMQLSAQLKSLKEVHDLQMIVDDVTAEGLVQVLYEQNERIFAFSSEGDILNVLKGRYGDGKPNFKIWLAGYDGSLVRINRKNGAPILLKRPAISLGLTFQPGVLRDLSNTPEFDDQGLIPRMLFSIPHSLVGYRKNNAPAMPISTYESYDIVIRSLLQIPENTDVQGNPIPYYLELSPDAREAYQSYFELNEKEMREGGAQESMKSWGGKFSGSIMKLAGLLHLSNNYNNPNVWEIPISADSMHRAADLLNYFMHHTKAAYGAMEANADIEDAKYFLRRIQTLNQSEFTKRDLFEKSKGKKTIHKVTDIEPGIKHLIEHNYIRKAPSKTKTTSGRPPSPIFEVNPELLQKNSHNSHNQHNTGNNANIANK